MNEQEQPKLTRGRQLENIMFAGSMMVITVAVVQWILTTWLAQWKHAKRKGEVFRPQMPRKITTFIQGGVPASDSLLLRQWGISNQDWTMWFVADYGTIGLERTVLVSQGQWEFADAILHQNGAMIVTEPGSKRGANFTKPWGVGVKARSFDEGINAMIGGVLGSKHHGVENGKRRAPKPKLGKTYS